MELNLQDRIVMCSFFPNYGNFKTMEIINNLSNKLQITEKETSEYKIVYDSESKTIIWDKNINTDKFIDLSDEELEYIKSIFNSISEKNELTLEQYKVYKKIENEITNN